MPIWTRNEKRAYFKSNYGTATHYAQLKLGCLCIKDNADFTNGHNMAIY